MFRRRPPAPPSAADLLAEFVSQAAADREREEEELAAVRDALRGVAAFAARCEGEARRRGSAAAPAFRLIGLGTRAVAAGADRAAAALPPPPPAAVRAVDELLGLAELRAAAIDPADDD